MTKIGTHFVKYPGWLSVRSYGAHDECQICYISISHLIPDIIRKPYKVYSLNIRKTQCFSLNIRKTQCVSLNIWKPQCFSLNIWKLHCFSLNIRKTHSVFLWIYKNHTKYVSMWIYETHTKCVSLWIDQLHCLIYITHELTEIKGRCSVDMNKCELPIVWFSFYSMSFIIQY